MPKKTPIINDFRSGELAPDLDARADLKDYYRGCRTLENAMPIIEGGVARVPGTYYVRPVKTDEGWNIRITKSGNGTGVVTSDVVGIDCGASCYSFFVDGVTVVLTATPDSGMSFAAWSGDGTGAVTRSVLMDGNKVVNAEFSSLPQWANLIAWYKVDEGTGTVITNSAPAGANKLPDLAIVAQNTNFWSQVSGFGYWDITATVTQVYATWAAKSSFSTKLGTVIVFAKEDRGVTMASTNYLYKSACFWGYFKNHPVSVLTMHKSGIEGDTLNTAYVNFTPRRYQTAFVQAFTQDTNTTTRVEVKYVGDSGWTTDPGIEDEGFNPTPTVGLYMGCDSDWLGVAQETWKGTLGDLMIWNVLLTDAEINTVLTQRGTRWGF